MRNRQKLLLQLFQKQNYLRYCFFVSKLLTLTGSPVFQELYTESDILHRVDECISNFTEFGLPFLEDYSAVDRISAVILGQDQDSPPLIFSDWSMPAIACMAGELDFAEAKLQERFLDPSWTDSLLPGLNLSRGEFARRFHTVLGSL